MSNLIIPGVETTARPNRKARLAQKAMQGSPVPNLQKRQRGIPPAAGAAVGMGPIGPMLVVKLMDGQEIPMPFTPDQANQTGLALIGVAAQYDLLKKMQADQADAEDPVPTNPDLEELLAESQAKTGLTVHQAEDLAEQIAEPTPPLDDAFQTVQFNSFDIHGQPCYEPPSD